jgi:hypothetical protein
MYAVGKGKNVTWNCGKVGGDAMKDKEYDVLSVLGKSHALTFIGSTLGNEMDRTAP